jgi:hypothetical protein
LTRKQDPQLPISNLDKLVALLERTLAIYEEDRNRAIENYDNIQKQLDNILDDAHMSEDGKIETELNKALDLVFKSSNKLETVIKTITNITISQLNNESRERVAKVLVDRVPDKAIDFDEMMKDQKQIEE